MKRAAEWSLKRWVRFPQGFRPNCFRIQRPDTHQGSTYQTTFRGWSLDFPLVLLPARSLRTRTLSPPGLVISSRPPSFPPSAAPRPANQRGSGRPARPGLRAPGSRLRASGPGHARCGAAALPHLPRPSYAKYARSPRGPAPVMGSRRRLGERRPLPGRAPTSPGGGAEPGL